MMNRSDRILLLKAELHIHVHKQHREKEIGLNFMSVLSVVSANYNDVYFLNKVLIERKFLYGIF